jgi:hypothetical protein
MELPVDTDGDSLPDEWESRANVGGAGGNLRDGVVDDENASGNHNERGDGFTALEEYRGFQWTDNNPVPGTHLNRMDEIPNSTLYNQTGNGGPQVKDLFVFHQSTVAPGAVGNLAMDTTDAALFSVHFHDIREPDFSVPQPAAARNHAHRTENYITLTF